MPSWSELHQDFKNIQAATAKTNASWLPDQMKKFLCAISGHYDNATTIFYASGFLQKSGDLSSITMNDVNGFMDALSGASTDSGLVLLLHTPGGDANAVESIVEYLHAKFEHISVIVPYMAMSGGAMISLASDLLILGKQSQLGPIDPYLGVGGQLRSARAIQEGFAEAKEDIQNDPQLAALWGPILQNMDMSLILQSKKSLAYSKELVTKWLNNRMFKDIANQKERENKANVVAAFFNAEKTSEYGQIHVHGQRIGAEKLKEIGLELELLEDHQELQDNVLSAYHIMTLIFSHTNSEKFITSHTGKLWNNEPRSNE